MTKIDTNLDYNHKSSWTEWQGIREILQNELDERDTIAKVYRYYKVYGLSDKLEFYVDTHTNRLIIRDYGRGLPTEAFIMGWGTKHEEKTAGLRGMFGVGLLEGILTLTRLGYKITVESVPKIQLINPNIQETEPPYTISGFRFEKRGLLAKVLVADLYENKCSIDVGTKITIEHDNPEKIRFLYYLATDRIVGIPNSRLRESQITEYGSIILKADNEGNLIYDSNRAFVQGIYVQDINSIYSYNVYSNKALGGSERDKIDLFEYQYYAELIIKSFNDINVIRHFIQELLKPREEKLIEYDFYYSFDNKDLWRNAFTDLYGFDTVILEDDFHLPVISDLNIPFINPDNYNVKRSFFDALINAGVGSSSEYVKGEVAIEPAEPTQEQLNNLYYALKLALKVLLKDRYTEEEFNEHFNAWRNRIFKKIYIRGEDKTDIILGMIRGASIFATKENPDYGCYINIKQLNDPYTAFGTLIHEYGHVYDKRIPYSGSSDYDRTFETYLEYALKETLKYATTHTSELLDKADLNRLIDQFKIPYQYQQSPHGIVFLYYANR